MEREFQSKQVIKEFNKLFKQAFPNGCHPRQKADLMSFFLAGYQAAGVDFNAAVKQMGFDMGHIFMEEILQDNHDRAKFLIECMLKEDYTHSMFKPTTTNNQK